MTYTIDSNSALLPNYNIAVVIPAYKAQGKIAAVLTALPAFIDTIVVVDDCSPDATAEIVKDIPDPRIHCLQLEQNQGVGGAMLAGYQKAIDLGAHILVKMDSDDQMDPHYLPTILQTLVTGKADYVKGNRFMHLRSLTSMPRQRRIGNIGLSFLTKLASGYWNIFDPTNGYTAIWSDVFANLDQHHLARRFFFETSLLIELGLTRAVVKDVYIPARYNNEKSTLSEIEAFFKFPIPLLQGCLKRILIQYFIRDFSALSLFLITGLAASLFGTVFGGYHWIRSIQTGIPTLTGTVMVAVLPFILGIQFLLQALVMDIQNVPKSPLHTPQNSSYKSLT
jgi:dolichol-phosphate mannosyltransferase